MPRSARAAIAAALCALLPARAASAEPAARDGTCAVDATGSTGALAVGEEGALLLAFRCSPGFHLQRRAPFHGTLLASPGLALRRDHLSWADATGPQEEPPRFRAPFRATAPGAQRVAARLAFFVCDRTGCARQEREVAVPVEVRAAGAAPGARSSP